MRKKRLIVALGVAAAALVIAGVVQASIPDSNGVAHGCYYIPPKLSGTQQLPGDLRLIDTDKGQHCNSDEGSVDLATTGFVTTTINQTSVMFNGKFPNVPAGTYRAHFFCNNTGYVAVDPSIGGTDQATASNSALSVHSLYNDGEDAGTGPNDTASLWFTLASTQSITIHATCVDGRVYGQPGPAAPAQASSVKPSLSVQKG